MPFKIVFWSILCLPLMLGIFTIPPEWLTYESHPGEYQLTEDENQRHGEQASLRIESNTKRPNGFGYVLKAINVKKLAGKRVRLTGYLKVEDVQQWAGLCFRAEAGSYPVAFDNMQKRGIKGSLDWGKYTIVLDIPSQTTRIEVGAGLVGPGKLWMDPDLQWEVVTTEMPVTGTTFQGGIHPHLKPLTPADLDRTRLLTQGSKKHGAAYLALNYFLKEPADWIYAEINVPTGEAPAHTYYSVLGGRLFYSGIQVHSTRERRVIFSVWDANAGNNNPRQVPDSMRATLLEKGPQVFSSRFGREGSGVHTHLVYDWKEDATYKFLIHLQPDSVHHQTIYTLFFEKDQRWKRIAKISTPTLMKSLTEAQAFLEDFSTHDDRHRRSASYQMWVHTLSGEWQEVTQAVLTLPFGDQNRSVKDYGCGLSTSNGFLLSSGGGYTETYVPIPTLVQRPQSEKKPVIDLPE